MSQQEGTDETVNRIIGQTEKLLRFVNELIELHEANEIIAFSDVLSSQIPTSFAAHAFDQFRAVMLRFEVLRLAACWGKRARDNNIPSILRALERAEVVDCAVARLGRDPARQAAYRKHLIDAAALGRSVRDDPRFRVVMNFRHKELAHNLTITDLEQDGPIDPMTRADGNWLLEQTEAIVTRLFSGLRAGFFDFEMTRNQARMIAQRLWGNCTFTNLS